MRTYDEVNKILMETGSETSDDDGSPSQRSTDEIVSIVLKRPMHDQNGRIVSPGLEYYQPLKSDRKIVGRLIVFFKRIVRKILKYLFLPIVEKQNAINAQMAEALMDDQRQLNAMKRQLAEMQETISGIEASKSGTNSDE